MIDSIFFVNYNVVSKGKETHKLRKRKGNKFMEIAIWLEELQKKAQQDPALKDQFLATRKAPDPLAAFCQLCRNLGYPIYDMDLIGAGEEFYAAIKRSTNGGGENSPTLKGEDDFYEQFFADLEQDRAGDTRE